MLTTDELDQMDDISGAALYSTEVKHIPYLTPEARDTYIEAARTGDLAARNALITDCLHYTLYKAAVTYQERQPFHSDIMDLIGHAHVKLLEAVPKALEARTPVKYLLSVAANEMRLYCTNDDPLIKRPRSRPYDSDHPRTVGIEAAADMAEPITEPLPEPEYQLLFDAVHDLSEQRREIVTAMYGLFGESTASTAEVAAQLNMREGTVRSYLSRAKTALAEKLGPYVLEKSM